MTWIAAAAAVAGPLISGAMGAGAAADGLEAQREGAARSDATQRYMYDTTRADNAGAMARGNAAGNKLGYLMGLGGSAGGGGMSADQLRAQLLPQFTRGGTPGRRVERYVPDSGYGAEGSGGGGPGVTIFTDGTSVVGQVLDDPGQSQIDEAGLSAAIQRAMSAQDSASSGDPAYGSLLRNFSEQAPELRKFGASDLAGDLVYQNGLQFGLDEGRKGIERQQSATGGLLSGATLKALTRFGNDYGTTKTAGAYGRFDNEQQQGYGRYVDRYNRYGADRDSTFNKLSTVAGSGQVATNQVGAAGQNYANGVSATAQGLGNAAAAAGIAGSNALSGGLQGAYGNYQTGELMKSLRGGSGISYPKYSGTSYNPFAPNYENSFDRM